jgi:hypothetical protein
MLHVVNWTTFDQLWLGFRILEMDRTLIQPRTSRSCFAGRGLRDFPVCLWLWPIRPRQLRARIKVGPEEFFQTTLAGHAASMKRKAIDLSDGVDEPLT